MEEACRRQWRGVWRAVEGVAVVAVVEDERERVQDDDDDCDDHDDDDGGRKATGRAGMGVVEGQQLLL